MIRVEGQAELHDVPLQHGLLGQDPAETEAAQVQSFKVSVQNQLRHGATRRGRVLQAVAAEARGKVHVADEGVRTDDGVLVKGVVVIETRPGTAHLKGGTREHPYFNEEKPDSLD